MRIMFLISCLLAGRVATAQVPAGHPASQQARPLNQQYYQVTARVLTLLKQAVVATDAQAAALLAQQAPALQAQAQPVTTAYFHWYDALPQPARKQEEISLLSSATSKQFPQVINQLAPKLKANPMFEAQVGALLQTIARPY